MKQETRMSDFSLSREAVPTSEPIRGILGSVGAAFADFRSRWVAAARFREELAFISSLPDRELTDMGFTRHDVQESRRLGYWVRAADTDDDA
jgi:uncharacterized protein YjiS (DUF1127 family)